MFHSAEVVWAGVLNRVWIPHELHTSASRCVVPPARHRRLSARFQGLNADEGWIFKTILQTLHINPTSAMTAYPIHTFRVLGKQFMVNLRMRNAIVDVSNRDVDFSIRINAPSRAVSVVGSPCFRRRRSAENRPTIKGEKTQVFFQANFYM